MIFKLKNLNYTNRENIINKNRQPFKLNVFFYFTISNKGLKYKKKCKCKIVKMYNKKM